MSHVVDPQEGCVVVLPVESQKRLVQILHFLPAFPAELLACLSQVCNTGRVSASLATMLIRTIHLRYEGYDTSPCTNAVLKSASSVPLWGIRDLVSHGVQGMGVKSQGKKEPCVVFRDATIPFFQIRSDPENSEYRRIRSDPILAQFFFFFYQCRVSILLSLFCVLNTIY